MKPLRKVHSVRIYNIVVGVLFVFLLIVIVSQVKLPVQDWIKIYRPTPAIVEEFIAAGKYKYAVNAAKRLKPPDKSLVYKTLVYSLCEENNTEEARTEYLWFYKISKLHNKLLLDRLKDSGLRDRNPAIRTIMGELMRELDNTSKDLHWGGKTPVLALAFDENHFFGIQKEMEQRGVGFPLESTVVYLGKDVTVVIGPRSEPETTYKWLKLLKDLGYRVEGYLKETSPPSSPAPALISRLRNGNENERISAANDLGNMRSLTALTSLCGVSKDKSPRVRASIAQAIGHIPGMSCGFVQKTLNQLLNDKEINVKLAAIESLAKWSDKRVKSLAAEMLNRESLEDQIMSRCVLILGRTGDKSSIKMLNRRLEDRRPRVWLSAILALYTLKN